MREYYVEFMFHLDIEKNFESNIYTSHQLKIRTFQLTLEQWLKCHDDDNNQDKDTKSKYISE